MFQMNKQLFDQCWPTIAAQIHHGIRAGHPVDGAAAAPSRAAAAEAGYVLGVAIGYALQVDQASDAPLSASIPGWHPAACGELNWPRISPSRIPDPLTRSRR